MEDDGEASSETALDLRGSGIYDIDHIQIDKSNDHVDFYEEDEDTGEKMLVPSKGYTMQPIPGYIGIKLNTSGKLYNEKAS